MARLVAVLGQLGFFVHHFVHQLVLAVGDGVHTHNVALASR